MSPISHQFIDRRSFLRTAVLSGAALTMAGCRSATSSSASSPQFNTASQPATASSVSRISGRPGEIIDTHIHVVHGNPDLKPIPEEMEQLMKAPVEAKAKRLQSEMDQAKVAMAFGMGQRESPETDPLGIKSTLEVAALVPGLKAIGIADPRRTSRNHMQGVERQIDRERDKIVALKAYLGYLHFGPEDPHYVPYYKVAAKYGLPVTFHTGDTWSTKAKVKFAHPLRVDEVAVDHPDVRFVMAHLGNPWLIDAAEVVFKNDNVWADLSGLYVGDEKSISELLKNPDMASGVMFSELKKALGYAERYDRFVYGSDWPLAPMAVYRKFIEAIIPKEHHEKVFRKNAEQLFRVTPQQSNRRAHWIAGE